jgi:protocatechuate 3,4-dioxygenase alpha subunit
MRLTVSPACTTGPYFPVEFSDGSEDLTHRAGGIAKGRHILLTGRVLEKGGNPTRNMVLEIWQPDSSGMFRHPLDPSMAKADPGFWNWGRSRTNKDGWYRFRTVIPGAYEPRAPHINVAVLGIGLTRRLVTTVFFNDTNSDPVLACVPEELRARLIPAREAALDLDGVPAYRWDVILHGGEETPFFLD